MGCGARAARRLLGGLTLASLALVGAGCATSAPDGPVFVPLPAAPPGRAPLYVYRADTLRGSGPVEVRLDGEALATLANGEYAAVFARPGLHRLRLSLKTWTIFSRGWNEVQVSVRADGPTYVRVWAEYLEQQAGPAGEGAGDYNAPGRAHRRADVNVFAAPWPAEKARPEIATKRLAGDASPPR